MGGRGARNNTTNRHSFDVTDCGAGFVQKRRSRHDRWRRCRRHVLLLLLLLLCRHAHYCVRTRIRTAGAGELSESTRRERERGRHRRRRRFRSVGNRVSTRMVMGSRTGAGCHR
jgi:hypothetical protein